MDKRLIIDSTVCSGCMSCVINCAQSHERVASPGRARIAVRLEPFTGANIIAHCHQCEPAECVLNCPEEAIAVGSLSGVYEIDYERCSLCLICVDVCPHEAMVHDEAAQRVAKCDLCGGEPVCAASCYTGALLFGREGEAACDKLTSRYFLAEKIKKKAGEDD